MTTKREHGWSCVLKSASNMQYSDNNYDQPHAMMFACVIHCSSNTMAWGPLLSEACQGQVPRFYASSISSDLWPGFFPDAVRDVDGLVICSLQPVIPVCGV